MTKTSARYKLFSASSAFFIWGSWAYYINSVESKAVGLVSGLTQGVASFIITLFVVYAVTKIYNALPESAWRLILPAILTVSCIAVCLVAIHTIAGTPRILPTIAPSLSVAFLFCVFTAYKLSRTETNKLNG